MLRPHYLISIGIFFGLEQFKWTSIRNASIKILSVMAILLFVQEREDLYIYIFIMAFSILLSQIVLWPKVKMCKMGSAGRFESRNI